MIKAHSNRRLHLRQVSILDWKPPYGQPSGNHKLCAVVDPVTSVVLIDERVAEFRGLRGYNTQRIDLKGPLYPANDPTCVDTSARYVRRRRKIDISERQLAEISISHDAGIAVATSLVLDQVEPTPTESELLDDGTRPAFHEPEWGDDGYFDDRPTE